MIIEDVVGVVEDLGQFKRLLDPGLHILCWPLVTIVGRLSLRIQQLDVYCETKTKDNVFVQVGVSGTLRFASLLLVVVSSVSIGTGNLLLFFFREVRYFAGR